MWMYISPYRQSNKICIKVLQNQCGVSNKFGSASPPYNGESIYWWPTHKRFSPTLLSCVTTPALTSFFIASTTYVHFVGGSLLIRMISSKSSDLPSLSAVKMCVLYIPPRQNFGRCRSAHRGNALNSRRRTRRSTVLFVSMTWPFQTCSRGLPQRLQNHA
jgi:hypothetical protein